jgi:hypothetical protein
VRVTLGPRTDFAPLQQAVLECGAGRRAGLIVPGDS